MVRDYCIEKNEQCGQAGWRILHARVSRAVAEKCFRSMVRGQPWYGLRVRGPAGVVKMWGGR